MSLAKKMIGLKVDDTTFAKFSELYTQVCYKMEKDGLPKPSLSAVGRLIFKLGLKRWEYEHKHTKKGK